MYNMDRLSQNLIHHIIMIGYSELFDIIYDIMKCMKNIEALSSRKFINIHIINIYIQLSLHIQQDICI